jgi:hypothetical protein
MTYTYDEIFNILGPEWHNLQVYYIDGVRHWAGCRLIDLLGISSSTWAFRGPKHKPKMHPPLYRMCSLPEFNIHRTIYMVTIEGIYRAIMKTKKCRPLRILLRKNGILI